MSNALDVDPLAVIRTCKYAVLLVLGAIIGVPVSAFAYVFLVLVSRSQGWVFHDVPVALGFADAPTWWPVVPLALAGLLVGLVLRYLPGRGGHSPADGFQTGPTAPPAALPGIFLAALVSLGLGAVIGPEAPLIALAGAWRS